MKPRAVNDLKLDMPETRVSPKKSEKVASGSARTVVLGLSIERAR
jgi:hypothetical protein